MRIAIIAPVWGRYLRTELFWRAVTRLAQQWRPHEVTTYVSGDEPEHIALAQKYGGEFVEVENKHLGKKFNVATEAAFHDGADYIMVMGSDDILSPALGDVYKKLLEDGPFYAGLSGLAFFEPAQRRALTANGAGRPDERQEEPIGPGRLLSRTLVHGMWQNLRQPLEMWPSHIKSAADWWLTMNMKRFGITGCERMVDGTLPDQYLADIKSTQNVWSYDRLKDMLPQAVDADYNRMVSVLPELELEIIRELEDAACPTCGTVREL